MNITVTTPPTEEPVTLAEAKAHLRVDGTDEDALITSLIEASRQICELFHGRAYVTRTYTGQLAEFPAGNAEIVLPYPPAASVTSIKYYDSDDVLQTMDTADYETDLKAEPAVIRPVSGGSWPSTRVRFDAIAIEWVAGFGAAAAVPERIKAAVKLQLSDLFENREPTITGTISTEIKSVAVRALLWPDRIVWQ